MGFFTKRGRRMVQMIGAGVCWGVCFALLTVSVVLGVDGPRGYGLAMCGVAITWTVGLMLARHHEQVHSAFMFGQEVGRKSVTRLR